MPFYCDYRNKGQATSLRFTQYYFSCEYRINLFMENVTPDWLRKKLNEQRGLASELARSTSLTADKISKILGPANRQIKHEEALEILAFFEAREKPQDTPSPIIQKIIDRLANLDEKTLVDVDRYVEFREAQAADPDRDK